MVTKNSLKTDEQRILYQAQQNHIDIDIVPSSTRPHIDTVPSPTRQHKMLTEFKLYDAREIMKIMYIEYEILQRNLTENDETTKTREEQALLHATVNVNLQNIHLLDK